MALAPLLVVLLAIACAGRGGHDEKARALVANGTVVRVVEPKHVPTPLRIAPAPAPAVDNDAMFACASAADCVVLEMGCCDHCNGGYLLSVNGLQAEQAIQNHRAHDCGASVCGHDRCAATSHAVCDAGECARIEEQPLGSAAAQVTVIRNSFAPR